MAEPTRYSITVKQWFQFQDVVFRPAETEGMKAGFPRYEVPAMVYNGSVDGTPFKDLCATADPVYESEEA